MTRRLIDMLTALSLVLCLAAVGLGARSGRVHQQWRRGMPGGWAVYTASEAGQLSVTWRRWWTEEPPPYRWVRVERTSPVSFRWRTAGFHGEWWQQDHRAGNLRAIRSITVPYWFLAAATGALPAARAYRRLRRRRGSGLCGCCGYDLRATPGRCPECGAIAEAGAAP